MKEKLYKLPFINNNLRILMVDDPKMFRPYHFYLDVTFASVDDIREVWPGVLQWQKDIRDPNIEKGLLPDYLKNVVGGRPRVMGDEIALECVRQMDDENLSNKEIAEKHGWKVTLGKDGKIWSRRVEYYVNRGRELRKAQRHNQNSP